LTKIGCYFQRKLAWELLDFLLYHFKQIILNLAEDLLLKLLEYLQ